MENFAKLDSLKFGLAGGLITALCIFVTTILVVIFQPYGMECASIIADIYGFLGYSISFFGAVLGAIYGFIDGFILTWIFALIYNKLAR
ncbi:MAG: hypothetical protein DRM99_05095 [Thermoplasmata archaeon]|nr:MAG: hypothetical protein DRM99_05095 [Thermoplasmata archaeon]